MRRTAVVLIFLVAAFGVVAVGCGQEQEQTATPETVEGEATTPTETTQTETTETETTQTETDTTETTETETTPSLEGDPAAGKEVFLGPSACGGCHTLADAGSTGAVGPNLDEAQPSEDRVVEIVTNGQGGMPSFSGSLSEQQIADVAAYVSSVAGS